MNLRIDWMEKLSDTPMDDYRKNAMDLILAPNLINVRKYSSEQSKNDKCAEIKRLDSNFKYFINYSIRNVAQNSEFEAKERSSL